MIEELSHAFEKLKVRVHDIRSFLDAPVKQREIEALEKLTHQPDFWNDQKNSQRILQKRKWLENQVETDSRLGRSVEDISAYFELAREGESVEGDIQAELGRLESFLGTVETESLLNGENDHLNAIVTIHPGAGGTESQDWAQMLLRMYLRWAERHGFRTEMLDLQDGEEAGIKSATFTVNGEHAYGLLMSEIGVHRLVRISPFDANKRRHTSFASVFVSPEIDESIEIKIEDKDLRVDTFRSTGAGGQHVNTTDSAVRITHMPSGIVVTCQNERSQHKNRDVAFKVLRSKLYEVELEKRRQESQRQEDAKLDIDFGSQIRSYVLHPYRLVKDHRTKFEVGDADRVLDGDLDGLIKAYLLAKRDRGSKAA
ncbi:MAG: peptide chain release factor 2 [Acidobacteriia bacterium]|nr:peptide chain release factor 2 [Terriglobia bacterium]